MTCRSFSRQLAVLALGLGLLTSTSSAGILQYGDADLVGTGTYPVDPKTGATLEGLVADAVTFGAPGVTHFFFFAPAPGDFPGTDEIYVGSSQTVMHDGYSTFPLRVAGPQILTMDYSSLVPSGKTIQTLTLGIAVDDMEYPTWGNPFTASINGSVHAALTNVLNGLNQTGPQTQFFTIGIAPALLLPSHVLTLSIDEGGDGGDGWAVDFLTIGVLVPEPSCLTLFGIAITLLALVHRRRR